MTETHFGPISSEVVVHASHSVSGQFKVLVSISLSRAIRGIRIARLGSQHFLLSQSLRSVAADELLEINRDILPDMP